MDGTVITYLVYLVVSVGLTVWVARTLFRHGRVFLVDVFDGDERIANAVNSLLVVGFYLLNLGYVTFALRLSDRVFDATSSIEALSVKVGGVLLVLGLLHFGNLLVFSQIRRRRHLERQPMPPVPPTGYAWPAARGPVPYGPVPHGPAPQ